MDQLSTTSLENLIEQIQESLNQVLQTRGTRLFIVIFFTQIKLKIILERTDILYILELNYENSIFSFKRNNKIIQLILFSFLKRKYLLRVEIEIL